MIEKLEKNFFQSNALDNDLSKLIIEGTLNDIAEKLSRTLGPYGSNTILEDRLYNHVVTKDGFTVLNKLKYDNDISNTILELIKSVSRSLVREVGDGSTSSIIISNALLHEINSRDVLKSIPPKEILDYLKEIELILEEEIKSRTIKIDKYNFSKISNIAAIANNNDDKAGDLIYEIYNKIGAEGFINLESSPTFEDSYIVDNGIELNRGYIHNIFVNQPNKTECILEKPFIFMCNDVLDEDDLEVLMELVGFTLKFSKPLLLIAKGYDTEVANFLKINKNQNKQKLQISATDFAFVNNNHYKSFEDLSVYLGCEIYDKLNGEEIDTEQFQTLLGTCDRVIMDEISTKIIGGFGDSEVIEQRILSIDKEIVELEKQRSKRDIDLDLFELQKRKAKLSCKTATLFVGGNSDLEKETRKYLMEDAIYACKSAIQHGYVTGGNMIIPKILSEKSTMIASEVFTKNINKSLNEEESLNLIYELLDAISTAFRKSFFTVLRNKFIKENDSEINEIIDNCISANSFFNLKSMSYEDDTLTNIINSSMTDIQIMKSSFSIVGLISTSNQFITTSIRSY